MMPRLQGLFVLVRTALVFAGLNNARPRVIVGAVLIGLAVFGWRSTENAE